MTTSTERRILYVTTHYPSVSQTFVFNEIAGLQQLGWTVVPVSINPIPETDLERPGFRTAARATLYLKTRPRLAVLASLGRALVASPRAFARTLWLSLSSAGRRPKQVLWRLFHFVEAVLVWEHCRREQVWRVHSHFGGLPSMLGHLAVEFGRIADPDRPWEYSFTVHGHHEIEDVADAHLQAKAVTAELIVAICDFTAEQVRLQIEPDQRSKVRVVRCGIQLDRFVAEPPRPLDDPPALLTVARLAPVKGHTVLLDALAELRRRGRRVHATFVGGGPHAAVIRERIEALGLGDQVELTGELHSDEVAKLLPHADVFCLPSFDEGIPVSIMEAMAVGVPVVATDVGGVGELVLDHRTGLLVEPGAPLPLADALAELLDHPELRARLVEEARAKVRADHEWFTTVRQLADLWEPA